ncbi:MAG: ABC transporter ATP-binding protein [Euryarchaeota archaeon]|nr:ABC transporter ATP-binding protein [Euryarchaeota archaeon]
MMIRLDNFSFAYAGNEKPVLKGVDLEIHEGEFVLIVGLSGSGKSTLIRAFNGLIPHFYGGRVSGRVTVDGMNTRNVPPARLASTVGMVFQDPENQLVMTNVENEMAFGLENLALPKSEMTRRIDTYGEYFGLEPFLKRFIPQLSGGEKQKVALASVLAMQPKYIVLDEPTSQLDDESASLYLDFLYKLNREKGVSIILVEHRLERCMHLAQRVLFMEEGRIIADGMPGQVMPHLRKNNLVADFNRSVPENGHGEVVLSAKDISFAYDRDDVLKGLSLEVKHQEVVAIIGDNGSGKSTLLRQLNGLLRPREGKVTVMGKDIADVTTASLARDIGYLGQNPNNYLFEETLCRELEFSLKNLGVSREEWDERITWALRMLNLEQYRDSFPRDLSCGERQRSALATILVGRPRILVLDEPTRGLDHWNKAQLAYILGSLREQGMTTIMVTHDYRFVAEHATRVLGLRDGALREVPLDRIMGRVRVCSREA